MELLFIVTVFFIFCIFDALAFEPLFLERLLLPAPDASIS